MVRERVVAASLVVAMLAAGGFIAAYVTGGGRLYEGVSLAACTAAFMAAALGWAFWLSPNEKVTDERPLERSSAQERLEQREEIRAATAVVTRSALLRRLLVAALGVFGLALVVPVRSLGPSPDDTLFHTKWRKGSRIVRSDGTLVRAEQMNVGAAEVVFPENAVGDPMSQATLIRAGPQLGGPDGYLAFSRVCTHAGCPVALYRAAAHELMCPCHQSVFDVARGGAVISGPADRALPQLPIAIGSDGVLVALGDFPGPVGPGFWERP